MSVSDADVAAALELFEGLGPLTTRKMMGGLCLYRDGTIFALLKSDGQMFLKATTPATIARLEDMDAEQWIEARKGADTPSAMPYWTLPDEALDDADLACDLARATLRDLGA